VLPIRKSMLHEIAAWKWRWLCHVRSLQRVSIAGEKSVLEADKTLSWKVNMGPIQSMLKVPGGLKPNPQADGLGYNPRCLSRDISLQASNETRDEMVSALIKNFPSIESFQRVFQGEFSDGKMGVCI
jgi:hypothetical protein